jgi:hypothetical protein
MSAERSAALVRWWVALYTLGLPPEIKQGRRDEIDDDLWCQTQEAAESSRANRSLGGEIFARLVFGVPADVSWRIEQRRFGRPRPKPERSLAMNARLPAVLALVGGAAWTIWPVHFGLLSVPPGEWQGGFGPTLTLVLALGGTVVLALATISLVAAAQDVFPGVMATLAILGALFSTLGVVAFAPAIVALPISSMVVVWQLSRVGALPRWIFWMHATAPILVLAIAVIGLAGLRLGDDFTQPLVWLVPVLWLYPLSWLAIGWSLLRRRTVAPDGIAGAGAA